MKTKRHESKIDRRDLAKKVDNLLYRSDREFNSYRAKLGCDGAFLKRMQAGKLTRTEERSHPHIAKAAEVAEVLSVLGQVKALLLEVGTA